MNFLTGNHPHAAAIAKALGIDTKTCVSIELRVAVDEVVTVTVERRVYDQELERLATVLDVCRLVAPDDGEQDVTAMADNAVRKVAA